MTPMLEKAARALAADMKRQADSVEPKYSGNGIVEPDHFAGRPLVVTVDHTFHLDELARAVLMAVREPDEVTAGIGVEVDLGLEWLQSDRAVPQVFTAMIDAILSEGEQ